MKPWQKNVLKLAFTALILALLYRKVDWAGFAAILRGARPWPSIGSRVVTRSSSASCPP